MATSLNNLALLYWSMGRYAEAEPLLRRSLAIKEKQLGRDHPDVAPSLDTLAVLSATQGRWVEAAESIDRARRVVRRHVARVLPALAEAEQLTFLKAKDESHLHAALALALARRDDPDAVGRSAGWVLNGKAVAQEALAQRALLARDRDDPAAARLADVRNRLAALTLASPKPGQEERFRAIDRLTAQERELSKQLGQNAGRPARDDPWVAPEEVRRALPADAVLVEIARFRVFNFQAKGTEMRWAPPRYAAWVIPPAGRGEVRLIDLGAADVIEADVAAVRRAIQPDLAALRRAASRPSRPHCARPWRRWPTACSGRCCRTSARRNAGCSAPMRRSGWSPGPRCRWRRIAPRSRTTKSTTSSAAATWPRPPRRPRPARRW